LITWIKIERTDQDWKKRIKIGKTWCGSRFQLRFTLPQHMQ
jgi:hypothetical protein